MNKIICAAIKIYIDSENIKIYRGHRHNNCIDCMNSELSWGITENKFWNLNLNKVSLHRKMYLLIE